MADFQTTERPTDGKSTAKIDMDICMALGMTPEAVAPLLRRLSDVGYRIVCENKTTPRRVTTAQPPTAAEIEAGWKAAIDAWVRWTGGRTALDGMDVFVRAALQAAAEVRHKADCA